MDAEDFESQELWISESISLAFHGFDFVVGSFQRPSRDGMVVVSQDAPGVEAKGFGKVVQHADAGGFGEGDPIHEQGLGRFLVLLFPDLV